MADEKVTIVDAQADIEGKLKGKDAIVQGRFRGEISLTGRLVVGDGGKVEASVSADAVEIAGEVKGDVKVRSLMLAEKGRVQGTVEARVLVVREGAWLNGSVSAGEQSAKPASPAGDRAIRPAPERPITPLTPDKPAPSPDRSDKGDKAGA